MSLNDQRQQLNMNYLSTGAAVVALLAKDNANVIAASAIVATLIPPSLKVLARAPTTVLVATTPQNQGTTPTLVIAASNSSIVVLSLCFMSKYANNNGDTASTFEFLALRDQCLCD